MFISCRVVFRLIALAALCLAWIGMASAQPTAFTYQGKLTDAGNPANGDFDLQFRLFDNVTVGLGAQQGETVVKTPVMATAGIFTVVLDFGVSVFGGPERFLDVGVRPAGSPAAYTVLSPRQPVTSSPYALQTLNAQQLGGLPASRYVASDANGNVGIGTANPIQARLQVEGGSGNAIWATSTNNPGVVAQSSVNTGAVGISTSGRGIEGFSTSGTGVYGQSYAASITAAGVFGRGLGTGAIGVIGESNAANATGVYGASADVLGFGMYARNVAGGRAIYAEGNVGQDRGAGGVVKAMALINANGTVSRCYNAVTNASTGGCGFSVGHPSAGNYLVNFGFQVDDRFVLANAIDSPPPIVCLPQTYLRSISGNVVGLDTLCNGIADAQFYIFVY